MTLPNSGIITMDMIRAELKRPAGVITLNDADVRKLAGKLSGPISLADFYGKNTSVPFVPNTVNLTSESGTEICSLTLNLNGKYNVYTVYPAYGAGSGTWANVPINTMLSVNITLPTGDSTDFEAVIFTKTTQIPIVSGKDISVKYDGEFRLQCTSTWWENEALSPVIINVNGATLTIWVNSSSIE